MTEFALLEKATSWATLFHDWNDAPTFSYVKSVTHLKHLKM